MSDIKWKIAEPNEGLTLQVKDSGVWIQKVSGELTDPHLLRLHPPKSRLGRLLPTVVLQLVDLGVASVEQGGLKITHS